MEEVRVRASSTGMVRGYRVGRACTLLLASELREQRDVGTAVEARVALELRVELPQHVASLRLHVLDGRLPVARGGHEGELQRARGEPRIGWVRVASHVQPTLGLIPCARTSVAQTMPCSSAAQKVCESSPRTPR